MVKRWGEARDESSVGLGCSHVSMPSNGGHLTAPVSSRVRTFLAKRGHRNLLLYAAAILLTLITWLTLIRETDTFHPLDYRQPQSLGIVSTAPLSDVDINIGPTGTSFRLTLLHPAQKVSVYLQLNKNEFEINQQEVGVGLAGSRVCKSSDACAINIVPVSSGLPTLLTQAEPLAPDNYLLSATAIKKLQYVNGYFAYTKTNPYRRTIGSHTYYIGPGLGLIAPGGAHRNVCFSFLARTEIPLRVDVMPDRRDCGAGNYGGNLPKAYPQAQPSLTLGAFSAITDDPTYQRRHETRLLLAGILLGIAGSLLIEAAKATRDAN